jgi:hypothetical protein
MEGPSLPMRDTELRFTATIHAPDGVRFTAASATPELLIGEIAAYVVSRCDYVLWAEDACRVRAFIDAGDPDAAINLYFARVGERWDEERLELAVPEAPIGLTSDCDPQHRFPRFLPGVCPQGRPQGEKSWQRH